MLSIFSPKIQITISMIDDYVISWNYQTKKKLRMQIKITVLHTKMDWISLKYCVLFFHHKYVNTIEYCIRESWSCKMALAICTACYKISVISFSKLMDIVDNKNQFYEFIHDTNDEWNIIFLKLKSVVATCIFYVKTASELSFLVLTNFNSED